MDVRVGCRRGACLRKVGSVNGCKMGEEGEGAVETGECGALEALEAAWPQAQGSELGLKQRERAWQRRWKMRL